MFGIVLIVIIYLLFATPIYAIESPTLISPANNSTISSIPTFNWQAVSGSTGYNILIDDEPTVISPYAKTPYYPTNPSYSPQTLNPGTYYWKVKAKDSSGNWSNFSNIWSFTLSASTPSPTPTATSNPTPTSSPSSTPSTSFTISNTPSQINSDQSFNILITLSLPNNPSSTFYLKGAFKTLGGSNYFGQTKVGSSWIKNGSGYSNQYKITTDSSGNWNGSLEFKPDSDDSGFTGTDKYIFKVGRYNASGSGPTWSNEETIKIVKVSEISDSNSPTYLTLSPEVKGVSTTVAKSKESTSSSKSAHQKLSTPSALKNSLPTPIGSIVKSSQSFKFLPIILGGILIIIGVGAIFYIKFIKE